MIKVNAAAITTIVLLALFIKSLFQTVGTYQTIRTEPYSYWETAKVFFLFLAVWFLGRYSKFENTK